MTTVASTPAHSPAVLTVVIGCATTCFAVASVYLMQPVMAEIGKTFHVSPNDARLAFSAASIAYAMAFFFLGPLTDRLDPRKMSLVGLLAAALGVAAASLVSDFRLLLVILALQGVAAALVPAAMFALIPRVAPKESVGTYFGFVIAATVLGITFGRSGMSFATAQLGLSGALQLCAAVLLLAAAINQVLPSNTSWQRSTTTLWTAYLNALRMLCMPKLLRLFGTGFLLFFGYLGLLTFLTLRLHQPPFSYDSTAIGSISLLGLSALPGAPLSGRLISKVGSLAVGLGALVIVLAAISCLAFARNEAMLSAGVLLLFFGVFSCQPAVFVRIVQRVGQDQRGAASSLYLLTCLGAGSTASASLGPVWNSGGWAAVSSVSALAVVLGAALLGYDSLTTDR